MAVVFRQTVAAERLVRGILLIGLATVMISGEKPCLAQLKPIEVTGVVAGVSPQGIAIRTEGNQLALALTSPSRTEDGVRYRNIPALTIKVMSEEKPDYLKSGMYVRFVAKVQEVQQVVEPVTEVTVIDPRKVTLGTTFGVAAPTSNGSSVVVGRIAAVRLNAVTITFPDGKTLQATLAKDARVEVRTSDLRAVKPGYSVEAKGVQVKPNKFFATEMKIWSPGLLAKRSKPVAGQGAPGTTTDPSVTKVNVPEGEALQKAQADVQSIFGADYQRAETNAAKSVLVKRMLGVAAKTQDDLAGKYALLLSARNIAVISNDFELGLDAIRRMDQVFLVNLLDLELGLISDLTASKPEESLSFKIVEFCLKRQKTLIQEKEEALQYIPRFHQAGLALLKPGKHDKKIEQFNEQSTYWKTIAEAYLQIKKGPANLDVKEDAETRDAHQVIGLYLFSQTAGTPSAAEAIEHFRKSSDDAFRTAAELEDKDPESFAATIALIEAWLATGNQHAFLHAKSRLPLAVKQLTEFEGLTLERNKKILNDLEKKVAGLAGSGVPARGFKGRTEDIRSQMVARYGGSQGSEAAVAMALQWLANHQNPNGSWSFDHTIGACQGRCGDKGYANAVNGATAMALLPFLGAGQTHKEGKYKKTVQAGLYFLLSSMKANGDLSDSGGNMYSHGLCAAALCDAFAMTQDKKLRLPAQTSLNYIVYAQDPVGGGWRYRPRTPGDTSVTSWQVASLKMGHMAELKVPPKTVKGAYRFLDSVQSDSGAAYGYTTPANGSATTAAGLLCRMYLGWKKDEPALERGVQRLSKMGPSPNNMYYNYYATQVMRHFGGEPWGKWNVKMRDQLVNAQSKNGHMKGSWFFSGGHGKRAGRLYSTSMATMMLEAYYRYPSVYGD